MEQCLDVEFSKSYDSASLVGEPARVSIYSNNKKQIRLEKNSSTWEGYTAQHFSQSQFLITFLYTSSNVWLHNINKFPGGALPRSGSLFNTRPGRSYSRMQNPVNEFGFGEKMQHHFFLGSCDCAEGQGEIQWYSASYNTSHLFQYQNWCLHIVWI